MPALLSINNHHYRRAGSDGAFLDHDRLFRARGWSGAVFAMRHRDNLPSPWEAHFVDEIEMSRPTPLPVRAVQAAKVLYSLEARRRLRGLLGRFRPDVTHVHSIYHHISPAILPILSGLGSPVVLTAHDYKLACPAYKMFSRGEICERCRSGELRPLLRRRCIHDSALASSLVAAETALHRALGSYRRHVDRIVCPSRFMVDKLIEWDWPPERLVHLRNFVDLARWPATPGGGGHLLYHGRLAPEKGLETLVRAAAAARAPVRIVGSGVMEVPLRRLAQELEAPVVFAGHQPEAVIPGEINAARAVVVPSEWYENASLACLEAMACAKAVVATRIGGNPEIVTDGETGWLVAPGDTGALAERLAAVMAAPDHRLRAMGSAARAFVERWHGPDRYFEATIALYRSLGVCV